MDPLFKKLKELSDLIKKLTPSVKPVDPAPLPELPKIKQMGVTSMAPPAMPKTPKMPGMNPKTKKDPKKVAQQIKQGHVKTQALEMLMFNEAGQWDIAKNEDTTVKLSPEAQNSSLKSLSTVSPKIDSWGNKHHSPQQDSLIQGLNVIDTKPIGKGISGAARAKSSSHPEEVILKQSSTHPDRKSRGHTDSNNINSAKREVLYHNMANNFFNMGKYVPTTAGFSKNGDDWSAQQAVKGGSHVDVQNNKVQDPAHERTIKNLYHTGELHKLAMMDNIMGHHDRHKWNYMMDKDNQLKLIDNGTAFDYKNFDPRDISHFHEIAKSPVVDQMGRPDKTIHPEAKKWLSSLSPKKARELFANSSYPQDSEHVKGFLKRLESMQNSVKGGDYKDVEKLLSDNRLSSGPMHEHHKKGAA